MGCCRSLCGHHDRRPSETAERDEEERFHQKPYRPLSVGEVAYAEKILHETRQNTPHPRPAAGDPLPYSRQTSCCDPEEWPLKMKTRKDVRREKRSDDGQTFHAELDKARYDINRAEVQEARFSHAQHEQKRAAAAASRVLSLAEKETQRETVEAAHVAARLKSLAAQADAEAEKAEAAADEAARRYSLAQQTMLDHAVDDESPAVAQRIRSLALQAELHTDKARNAALNASRRQSLMDSASQKETLEAVAVASRLHSLAVAADQEAQRAAQAAEVAHRKSDAALAAAKILRTADKTKPGAVPKKHLQQDEQHQRSLLKTIGVALGLAADDDPSPLPNPVTEAKPSRSAIDLDRSEPAPDAPSSLQAAAEPATASPTSHNLSADEQVVKAAATSDPAAETLATVPEVPTPVPDSNHAAAEVKPELTQPPPPVPPPTLRQAPHSHRISADEI